MSIRKLHKYYPRPRLDGIYVPRSALDGRADPCGRIIAFDGGRVRHATRDGLDPVARHELANRAYVLFGLELARLGIRQDSDGLKQWVRQNMNDYWASWVDRATRRPVDAMTLALVPQRAAWGVLGVSRQAYTLREGGVISKTRAGESALAHAPPEYHRVLREALRIRRGAAGSEYPHRLARRLDVLRYMRHIIVTYGGTAD